jgi:RimJ/RimL family protein N-acetyltransferase
VAPDAGDIPESEWVSRARAPGDGVGARWFTGRMGDVGLRPWAEDDLETLRRSNAPEMMTYLGGPETEEALAARHERYLRLGREGTAWMFRIVTPDHPEGVGTIGYWRHEHHGERAFETGWSVETAYQGRGIATAALEAVLADAATREPGTAVYAYPRVENAASNAICRKAGFTLEGEEEFEHPKGTWKPSNVWVRRPSGA